MKTMEHVIGDFANFTGCALKTSGWTRDLPGDVTGNTGIVVVSVTAASNNILAGDIGSTITHADGDSGTLLDMIVTGGTNDYLWIRPDSNALANDFNWGVIELNASDARNAENIRNIALSGSINETFTATGEFITAKKGGRKLIIMDEADNLFERIQRRDPQEKDMSDHGGKAAIIETLKRTQQPVILIVNDLYELTRNSGDVIKQLSEVVKFTKIRQPTVRQILRQICELEGVKIMTDALDELSRRADGDLRAAINDLQSLALGAEQISFDSLSALSTRNVKSSIFDAVREILKATDVDRADREIWAGGNVKRPNRDSWLLWDDLTIVTRKVPATTELAQQCVSGV